jgi:HAD superfamily hydrolase (TIGR01509 family)
VGAKVIPAPGEKLESATILVRDGVIEAVGTDITVPAGYRVYDVKGKTLLPAFIEAALPVDSASAASTASAAPGAHWNASVTPEVRASELPVSDATIDALRAQGFAVARVLPANGILRGATDLRVLLKSSERPLGLALNGKTAQVIGPRSFDFSAFFAPQTPATPSPMVGQPPQPTQPRSERSGNYPSSLMGSYALMRQTFLDANWRAQCLATAASALPPEDMTALDALQPLVTGAHGVLLDVVAHYKRIFVGRDAGGVIQPFSGARDLLGWLSIRGSGLAVATGKSRAGLDRQFGTTGLGPLFHGSRCADETHPKPHPAMLLELMDEFSVSPSRTLMIGDTSHDRLMAESAGTAFVGVTFGAHPREALHGPATRILCDDYGQLDRWLRTHEPVAAL